MRTYARPFLRQTFFVRRHCLWGWAVCWQERHPLGEWGINWGIACKTISEAKAIRRFLNGRVLRPDRRGCPFADVVRVAEARGSAIGPERKFV
jgi:hypothetical protein